MSPWREAVQPPDADAVTALVATTGYFDDAEVAIARELVEERLAKGEASGYFFLFADAPDGLAGYACYGPTPCTEGTFDLYWVAVDPKRQGQGLGRRLVEAVVDRIAALGGRALYADTAGKDQYASTRAFYRGTGFECVATLDDFYAPGDAKLIYRRRTDR